MVRLSTPLYTAQLPQENNYNALPAGQYIAIIKKAELKDNSKKTGQIIKIQYQVIDGQFKGKSFFDSLNISNPNETAVEIGLSRLNSILTIGGLNELHDTDDLVRANIIVLATLIVENDNGNEKNKLIAMKNPSTQQQLVAPTMQQSYLAQAPVAQPVYQQPQQSQPVQNWQQPQAPVQQQRYTPVAQPQMQSWQTTAPQQPFAPTMQNTQALLDDNIPF